jgi:hypothetical protein
MSTITINTQYVSLVSTNKHSEFTKGFVGTFIITSALDQLGIRENDEVVISTPIKDDLSFVSEGIITKVNQINRIPPPVTLVAQKKVDGQVLPKDKYQHNFQIDILKDLKTNNLLSDLEYSIKAVYRFNKPIVHFQQQYRDLTRKDYETIVKGWVYTTRTTFGKLVNAIPRQNKLEFMLQAMDYFSTVDFKNVPLYDGVDFLYKYISKRILSRGKLIVETNNLIKEQLSDIVPYNEIGFFNPENSKSDNLSTQADLFEKLFALESKSDIRKLIKKSVSEDSQLEHRFLQIFKSETWPIDLSI